MKKMIRITTLALTIFGATQAHAANISEVTSVECASVFTMFKFDFVRSTLTKTRIRSSVESIHGIRIDQANQLISFNTEDGTHRTITISGSGEYGYAEAELLDENGSYLLDCAAKTY
ncbi:MAG: hypothetical protein ACKOX6_14370 [Bdellovibrio sp.]